MSRMADEALRILQPLSAVIDKAHVPTFDRAAEALAALCNESEERYRDLEQRFLTMQHENMDLMMRNRILSEVSARDSLTGLYNRWYVMEKIECEMNRSLRHGSPVTVLMMDIDHFKLVNDTWGHAVGDQVLKTVGQVLRDSCRIYDVPGRYGGEEFCVVLPETAMGSSPAVAERIRTRVESSTVAVDDLAIHVTASIGIAGIEAGAADAVQTANALIDRADRALYVAKHRGRNRVEMSC
jgi:diguanylate cyclase (GGDEF)-like protein